MRGVLLAEYGVADADAQARSKRPLERELAAALPDAVAVRAVASPYVLGHLRARGVHVFSVREALDQLVQLGVSSLVVQPVMVAPGRTYDAVAAQAQAEETRFERMRVGAPLLGCEDDARTVTSALLARVRLHDGGICVLVGHGAGARADAALHMLERAACEQGRRDVRVATLSHDGPSDLARTLPSDISHVNLVPVLLSCGGHVTCDLLGDGEQSWRSRLTSAGLSVTGVRHGLLELPEVRQVFIDHVLDCIEL